jgi:putative membrane protein
MAHTETIKKTGVIGMLVGVAVIIGLTAWSGWRLVVDAVASVGVGILVVTFVRAMTVSVAGLGWQLLFPRNLRPPAWRCVLLRFVREGANNLLPFAQVGGDLVGARLLAFSGVSGALSLASVIVDVLLQAVTQLLFAICGLAILISLGEHRSFVWAATPGFIVAMIALGGFYWVQRHGGRRIILSLLNRIASDQDGFFQTRVEAVYDRLTAIYASRSTLLTSSIVHFIGWLIGGGEVYATFAFMDVPVSWAEALVIESLIDAVRGAAFALPGALGAQEGGLIVLCALFGVPPDQALALSLVKRVADLALGLPGLLAWQIAEGRRLRAGGRASKQHAQATDKPSAGT